MDGHGGPRVVNGYTLLTEAGRGMFCTVTWAEDQAGQRCAVKVFDRYVLANREVAHFDAAGASRVPLQTRIDEELRILGGLRHPNVVALREVIDEPARPQLYAVMEGLVGGQLMDWSEELSAYSATSRQESVRQLWGDQVQLAAAVDDRALVYREVVAAFLFRQLLSAVEHLHGLSIIHKDLKPDNILLTLPPPSGDPRFVAPLDLSAWPALRAPAEGAGDARPLLDPARFLAKIGDFNTAVTGTEPDCLIYDAEGTQMFTPPECFSGGTGDGIRGKPRDMWSLGCVLFAMLFGRCPFQQELPIMLQLSILSDALVVPGGIATASAESLLQELLQKEPSQRPTAEAALRHEWLQ